jgi:hypothetical protein
MKKIFRIFFLVRVPPYGQNEPNFFPQPHMTIHTPIERSCRVDKKYAVSKIFLSDFWPQKSKNSVKIGNFMLHFENSCFDL